jgi:GNAT superfamily N-acetyltransferase
MPVLKLPLSMQQFLRLPRNPAYKYEYFGDQAYLSPRPKTFHAVLDLASVDASEAPQDITVRLLEESDWRALPRAFAAAFDGRQPFGSLDEATQRRAARQCLKKTRTGGDGPLIAAACFVAEEAGKIIGAILPTLVPLGDPTDWHSYDWDEPPPADAVAQRRGRAHLTWIFVAPLHAGTGVGSALLGASVRALLDAGYTRLFSTFLLGNDSSLLWHWRNGFRLLPYAGSRRAMRKRFAELQRHTATPDPPKPARESSSVRGEPHAEKQ